MKNTTSLMSFFAQDNTTKLIYVCTFIVISFFLIKWSTEVGMDTDAIFRIEGGKSSVAFFKTLGRDTTYKSIEVHITKEKAPHNIYYGTGVESTAVVIANFLGKDSYKSINTIRKIILVILSLLGFFILSLFVKQKLNSWLWGTLTLLLIFFSPTFIGYSFWQTKDAPVAAGFSLALYSLYNLFISYPDFKKKYLVGIFFGTFLITIVRVHGILVIFYLGVFGLLQLALFWDKHRSFKLFFKFYLVIFLSIFLGLTSGFLFYPYFWEKGYFMVLEAIRVLSNHPENPLVLFEGSLLGAKELPLHYLPKMMIITFPIFMLIMFLFSLFQTVRKLRDKEYLFFSIFFLFTLVFPIAYLMIKRTPVYTGWRQELFVYDSFILFSVIGFANFIRVQKKYIKIGIASVVIVFFIKTGISCFRYAPYQYLYYNELVGGIEGAFGEYNLDWAQVSVEPALDHLIEKEGASLDGKTILCNVVMIHDMNLPDGTYKLQHSGFIRRNYLKWDYAVFIPLFVPPNILELSYPPKGTVEEIKIEGVPICCVVKRENFDDSKGIEAYKRKDYKKAFQYFIKAYEYDNNNYILYPYLAVLSYQAKQFDNALIFAKKQLSLYPDDQTSKQIVNAVNRMKQDK